MKLLQFSSSSHDCRLILRNPIDPSADEVDFLFLARGVCKYADLYANQLNKLSFI